MVSYSYVLYTPLSRGMFIGSRTWPPLHLDAVVAMRSESRAGPRAMATVEYNSVTVHSGVYSGTLVHGKYGGLATGGLDWRGGDL